MAEGHKPRRRARGFHGRALLWKRSDFRESSRIVTLVTREHGPVHALAKGAHRPDSPFLGRLDFLNELAVELSPDRGGLRLLLRAELLHERRALREARRFVAASHFAYVANCGLVAERPDPDLFDLIAGGLTLIERCPESALRHVVLGLELRLLAQFGALPDLDHCCECARSLDPVAFRAEVAGGLACRTHAAQPRRAVGREALQLLRSLRDGPGRSWPSLAERPLTAGQAVLPAQWLAAAVECRSPLRSRVFARLGGE